ncbi:MAG TPA: twin-arginine translocation signal domain-containing protein, partial [Acidobacteriota bacterium]|nr:twin-arginine translocation signal domain-containing protein [Acidobacteriota bacterium]
MAKRASNEPWVLERRAFLQLGAAGLTSLLVGWPNPAKAETLSRLATGVRAVTPRNSARNCILVMLRGGPSHVDMFDLKKGRWT